jgi:rRNA maturation endonuclease Nob1
MYADDVYGNASNINLDFSSLKSEKENDEKEDNVVVIEDNVVVINEKSVGLLCKNNPEHKGIKKVNDTYICAICEGDLEESDYIICFISGGTVNYKLSPKDSEWSYSFVADKNS